MNKRDFTTRFWSKVEKTDGCWLWTGARGAKGHGIFDFNGKAQKAHRVAYDLTHDTPLGERLAYRSCNNPLCVRPDHITPDKPDRSCRKTYQSPIDEHSCHVRLIPLCNKAGEVVAHTTVDNEDYDQLMQFSWCISKGYAVTPRSRKVGRGNISMHRIILNAPSHAEVDHRDGNKLNNVRSNLRLSTHAQNQCNIAPYRADKTSSYKGVRRARNRWQALIKVNQVTFFLGTFDTQEAAAQAYDKAARHHFGEFAHLNFPNERR